MAKKNVKNRKVYTGDKEAPVLAKPVEEEQHTLADVTAEKNKRKRKLLQMAEQQQIKAAKVKKKRLDKYIEHQLKREEKEILLQKLKQTRIDTSILKSSKLIGVGDKLTKREKIVQAMEQERKGQGNEYTRGLLYDQREIKEMPEDEKVQAKYDDDDDSGSDLLNESDHDDDDDEQEDFKDTGASSSTGFIDYRPLPAQSDSGSITTSTGFGFGFANVKTAKKKTKKAKNYSWREKIEKDTKKKLDEEDEADFDDDDEEEEDDDDDDEIDEDEEDNEDEVNNEDGELADDSDNEDVEAGDSEEMQEESEDDDDDDDDESSSEEEDEEMEEQAVDIKKEHTKKALDFKSWAEDQVRAMEGRAATTDILLAPQMEYKRLVREEDLEDGLKEDVIPINLDLQRKIATVSIQRSEDIQKVRQALPVYAEEYRIMEAIHHNDCVVICGETGSGKTTQVPQFLFESGYGSPNSSTPGMIGITQPRRVAAVSMAKRVGNEMGNYGHKVGYQIRFDATVDDETSMKFMTDGVLLREMMQDFLLTKYSALIIDEAHERNVNTDILIGMLSRVLKLRREYFQKDPTKYYPLKLVIMSATLRVSDFSENQVLFDTPPPVLKVDARQFPVSVHFNKRTAFNYTEEAFRKTCKIHQRLPKGAILVFMTGKAEIVAMVKKLRKEFPMHNKKKIANGGEQDDGLESMVDIKIDANNADIEAEEIDFDVKDIEIDDAEDDYPEDSEEEEGFDEQLDDDQTDKDPLYVLPLYSLLPTSEQMKIFEDPPAGARLCVVATNVAETSLTIPNVRYVVDCGRAKERKYNEETGVQSFEIDWISKASADQRSGRAGRTGPGHTYRLFSAAVYENDFPQFSKPEILRMPVEGVVLNMKSMGIHTIANFPFPTAPDRKALVKAEKLLKYLGALDNQKGLVTPVGKKMSLFPLSPRFSKMLLIANQQGCLPYVIALVSGLSVGDPFLTEFDVGIQINEVKKEKADGDEDDDEDSARRNVEERETQQELESKRKLRSKFNKSKAMFTKLDPKSDALKLLSAICASDHIPMQKKSTFFKDHFLREKQMMEISKLRKQLTYIVNVNTLKDSIAVSANVNDEDMKLGKPTKLQIQAIKQMIAVGFIDQIAVRLDIIDKEYKLANKMKIMNVPYMTAAPSIEHAETEEDGFVFIHPSSVLMDAGEAPDYLVYQSVNKGVGTKLKIKPLNDISAKALANVAKNSALISYSKPLGHPYGPKMINSEERECYVVAQYGAELRAGSGGWSLGAHKVHQKKIKGVWEVL